MITEGLPGGWRPTHAHARAVGLGLACLVVAAIGGRPELVVLGTPFVAVATWGQLRRPHGTVTASVEIEATTMFEGQVGAAAVAVRSSVATAAGPGELVAAVVDGGPWVASRPSARCVAIADADDVTVDLALRAVRWGRHPVDLRRLVCTASLGAYRADPGAPPPIEITTLPLAADFAAVDAVPRPGSTVGVHRSHRHGPGAEPADVRPFRPGDRVRRVNWAVSSRTGTLHVTSSWAERDTRLLLLLDTEHDIGASAGIDGASSSLDTAVRAAAAIAERSLRTGDRVELVDLGRRVRDLRPGTGLRHLRRVLDVLVAARPGASHRSEPVRIRPIVGGALVVVLTPLVGPTVHAQLGHLVQHGHAVVVVDTLPPGSDLDASPWRALARRLRAVERQVEIERLGELGVPVVRWRGRGTLDEVLRHLSRLALAPRSR